MLLVEATFLQKWDKDPFWMRSWINALMGCNLLYYDRTLHRTYRTNFYAASLIGHTSLGLVSSTMGEQDVFHEHCVWECYNGKGYWLSLPPRCSLIWFSSPTINWWFWSCFFLISYVGQIKLSFWWILLLFRRLNLLTGWLMFLYSVSYPSLCSLILSLFR